jgi:hypothetical protein
LRINFRRFVGDVEWLACAESSSGKRRFDGELVEERLSSAEHDELFDAITAVSVPHSRLGAEVYHHTKT